ncbi:MAG: LL-diaminopimelate aminotransferase [Phycisphaerales bacterium]|nr:LL-diaminopimelate aminotransferase [Phycisphaerales bacterium]
MEPADRLKVLPPYLFVEIDRKKREAMDAGRDVIDFGVGDPERPTPDFIIGAADAALRKPAHHRYPLGIGMSEFRASVARFFEKRYGVKPDEKREVVALIGSKEGLGHLTLAIVNPGDFTLIPDPAYPVYLSGTYFAGGRPHFMPLREENDFLPDLDAIPEEVARRSSMMFLNYPNNPTGAIATRAFFERAVAFAREHDILLVQDAAYCETFYADPPPSILQIRGANDVAVELHSLSKTFNMTGWRVGFAVGNAAALTALAKIKANFDSGVFGVVQEAAIAALEGSERPELRASREMYRQRCEVMAEGLRSFGLRVKEPAATFYVWAGLPEGLDSMAAATRLLEQADVVCVPGIGFGESGEGFIRFAMTVDLDRVKEALRRLEKVNWK